MRNLTAAQHDRLEVEKIILASGPDAVKTSDVARLMELFQSALLHYWEFEPKSSDASTSSDETKVEKPSKKGHKKEIPGEAERSAEKVPEDHEHSDKPQKRVPVIFFDEAHKLLVQVYPMFELYLMHACNQPSPYPLDRCHESSSRLYARVDEAGQAMSRRPCDQR